MDFRSLSILFVVMFGLFLIMSALTEVEPTGGMPTKAYSEFITDVNSDKIESAVIRGNEITARNSDGDAYQVISSGNPELADKLSEKGVRTTVIPVETGGFSIIGIFLSWLPMLLLIGVWVYFMRGMQGGGKGLQGFGKSKAKLLTQETNRVTFADVAGCDEAKQEVEEIVEFLRDPKKFQVIGGKIPKGVLMVGPPGTGKTLLARAIAGEANVPFFSASGSDFVEMFVGVGAARVRDMFEQAKKNAPCIIFIDEVDAIGRHRGAGLGGGHDEREQTLNSILVEMDGFEANEGVIIIAATNRPDVLDPALLRPGRFDRQVVIPNPDLIGRVHILKVHMKKVKLMPNWSDHHTRTIARKTPGMSGADLANLVNEAALHAARAGREFINMFDFENASDKIMMGTERRNLAITEEDKRLIAYHEAGHALVGLNCKYHDPLHKITIIPRGRAMGVTMNLPTKDRWGWTKSELLDRLASMYGGREAEALEFGSDHITTGASNDIQQATNIARAMVREYGMGTDRVGRVRYSADHQEVFLGHSVSQTTNVSQKYAEIVDEEVLLILSEAEQRARTILMEHKDDLDKIAEALLIYETLDGAEVKTLLEGGDLEKPDVVPPKEAKEMKDTLRKKSFIPSIPLKTPAVEN